MGADARIGRMLSPLRRRLPWIALWLLVAVAGAVWLAQQALARQREAFDTDARIAHRLLSQRAVQHDAMLGTLALLQPDAAERPEQRLPALQPQVLRVLRRDPGTTWPDAAWAAAEAESRRLGRAVLAQADLARGRSTLLIAGTPTSFALELDLRQAVPLAEWPIPADSPVRVSLQHAGRSLALQSGHAPDGPWRFDFRKKLASDSQPFEVVLERGVGWAALPWPAIALWTLASAGVLAAVAAWRRQRSARRRAEELLRLGQVARLNTLGELAAGMAHELNQPLTAVLANTQAALRMLADEPAETDAARAAMQQAASQARRASDVLGRLRRVVERPDGHAPLQPVALEDAVRNALYLLEPECRRRQVDPALDGGHALKVLADPVALEQIVHNLLHNALQALEGVPPEQRALSIAVRAESGRGVLRVEDSGPGIPDDQLAHVFEPFFSTRRGGLGLGLSLCETLAAGMGGSLSVHARAPRGAVFRLALPLATGQPA